jgi:cation diffusion facilitator CzcD-associated flavoprotein CzcO
MKHYDVIIIGAGPAGIAAAYYLKNKCPAFNFCILESRDNPCGTWNLYKYPGVRADSDAHTMAYKFKPWQGGDVASGDEFENYLLETIQENDLLKDIKLNHKVSQASWDSNEKKWSITSNSEILTSNFIFVCAGYYDYEQGYIPELQGLDTFNGTTIHPQFWPKDFDYTNKNITVIGSGATAISIVPELSKKAKHVVMLQRSPTYIADFNGNTKSKLIKEKYNSAVADKIIRLLSNSGIDAFIKKCKNTPNEIRNRLKENIYNILGKDYDVEKHFNPKYNPWDQRMCLDKDNELLLSIKDNRVSMITDNIEKITSTGIKLTSGEEISTDIIVFATGLKLKVFGGIEFYVDDNHISLGDTLMYKGAMFSKLPNLFAATGYARNVWTLKFELISEYACRLMNYMNKNKFKSCIPVPNLYITSKTYPFNDLTSNYVVRSLDALPKQGSSRPWQSVQNYDIDLLDFKLSKFDDGFLNFKK